MYTSYRLNFRSQSNCLVRPFTARMNKWWETTYLFRAFMFITGIFLHVLCDFWKKEHLADEAHPILRGYGYIRQRNITHSSSVPSRLPDQSREGSGEWGEGAPEPDLVACLILLWVAGDQPPIVREGTWSSLCWSYGLPLYHIPVKDNSSAIEGRST